MTPRELALIGFGAIIMLVIDRLVWGRPGFAAGYAFIGILYYAAIPTT